MRNTTCFGFLLCAIFVGLIAVAIKTILIVLGVLVFFVILIGIAVAASSPSKPPRRIITQSVYDKVVTELLENRVTQKTIAARYGIDPREVSKIKCGLMGFEIAASSPSKPLATGGPAARGIPQSVYDKVVTGLRETGVTQKTIAGRHGIDPREVSRIKLGVIRRENLPP